MEVQSVGNRVGVTEPFLMHTAHGAPVRRANIPRNGVKGLRTKGNEHGCLYDDKPSEEQTLRVCKRFYVALILSRLVQVYDLFLSFVELNLFPCMCCC